MQSSDICKCDKTGPFQEGDDGAWRCQECGGLYIPEPALQPSTPIGNLPWQKPGFIGQELNDEGCDDPDVASPMAGVLEVGTNDKGEVVINHPDLQPDENGVGHIIFSRKQAMDFARIVLRKALDLPPTEDELKEIAADAGIDLAVETARCPNCQRPYRFSEEQQAGICGVCVSENIKQGKRRRRVGDEGVPRCTVCGGHVIPDEAGSNKWIHLLGGHDHWPVLKNLTPKWECQDGRCRCRTCGYEISKDSYDVGTEAALGRPPLCPTCDGPRVFGHGG